MKISNTEMANDIHDECDEREDNSYVLTIYGVNKNISELKLKSYIEQRFGKLRDICLIPYMEWNIANVTCSDRNTYERLLHLVGPSPVFDPKYVIRRCTALENNNETPSLTVDSSKPSILLLNDDCLRAICEKCSLRTQMHLTKVSRGFLSIVRSIWSSRFRDGFRYDLFDYEIQQDITLSELHDFAMVCGPYVQRLRFNTIFYFPLIQRHLVQECGGNLMQNAKKFINETFCQNLQYFCSVQAIEVEGKFLADFTTKEIARYCKQLSSLRLLDTGTRWLEGQHLYLLDTLTELCLKDCENLKPRNMLNACKSLKQLQSLDITDCTQLQSPEFIRAMCRWLTRVVSLKMSATANASALDAVLKLPILRRLRFSWLNSFPEFERVYLAKLLEHKQTRLDTLTLDNDRVSIANESHEFLTPRDYAMMRERTTLNGGRWVFRPAETEAEVVALLSRFPVLREIHFVYCRPLAMESLLDMCCMCPNLQRISFLGCRTANDERWLQGLEKLRTNASMTLDCEMHFGGDVSASELQRLHEFLLGLNFRIEGKPQPVLRSLSAVFN